MCRLQQVVYGTLSDTGAISCTECAAGKYSTNSTVQCESLAGSVADTLSDTGAISCTEWYCKMVFRLYKSLIAPAGSILDTLWILVQLMY